MPRSGLRPVIAGAVLLVLAGCQHVPGEGGLSSADRAEAAAGSAETLARLGDHLLTQGDVATAVALYRRAHAAAPAEPSPLIKLGSALYQLGSYREAAGAYRSVLQIDPKNGQAARGLANAHLAMNEPEQALPFLEIALAAADTPANRNSMGVALDMAGRHAEAQASYRAGLLAAPDDLDLASNLALSLALAGRHADAILLMQDIAAAPVAGRRHRQNLALVYGLAGLDDQAAAILRADLSEGEVAASLAAIARLRAIPDSGARATAIGGGAAAG